MGVEGTAGAGAIIKAVQDAGYGASLKGASEKSRYLLLRQRRHWKTMKTPALKTKADRICRLSACADVFFHGTYDVGLASSGMV